MMALKNEQFKNSLVIDVRCSAWSSMSSFVVIFVARINRKPFGGLCSHFQAICEGRIPKQNNFTNENAL